MPTYPSIGPNPDTPLATRPYLDDGINPSRATLVGEPDMGTGDHAQAHENATRLAMAAITAVGSGWVPSPVGVDGGSPITWTVVSLTLGRATPDASGNTVVSNPSQSVITASADVSAIIGPGSKLRVVDTTTKYLIVVSVSVASGVSTLVVQGSGRQTDLVGPTLSSVFYSVGRPFGFPLDPLEWDARSIRNQDVAMSNNGTFGTQKATSPAGVWEVTLQCVFAASRTSAGTVGGKISVTVAAVGSGVVPVVDNDLSTGLALQGTSGTQPFIRTPVRLASTRVRADPTEYFIIGSTTTADQLTLLGTEGNSIIRIRNLLL